MNQRFVPVPFTGTGTTLTATLPAEPGVCVPGHYMLFVLTRGRGAVGGGDRPHRRLRRAAAQTDAPARGAQPARLLAADEPPRAPG